LLVGASLFGASLFGAQLQGVDLSEASLTNATLLGTQLQGATFDGAELTHATLRTANLYRVLSTPTIKRTRSSFSFRQNQPFLISCYPPDGENAPRSRFLDTTGYKAFITRALAGIQSDEIKQAVTARLQLLDPEKKTEDGQLITDKPINSDPQTNDRIRTERVKAVGELICDKDGAPYIARGFIYNGRILGMEQPSAEAADDPALLTIATLKHGACPGADGLDVNDFRELDRIASQIVRTKDRRKGKSVDDNDDDDDK
jgi:Pentapeptide repeats (8 copies)